MEHLKLFLAFLMLVIFGCNQNDTCDAFPSFQIYFSIQDENGGNIFESLGFDIQQLNVRSDVDNFFWDQSLIREFNNKQVIGIDKLSFIGHSIQQIYFDFGNGSIDTLRVEDGGLLDQTSCDVFNAEGVVHFYYNDQLQASLDLSNDDLINRLLSSREEDGSGTRPYVIELKR